MKNTFTERVLSVVASIPKGKTLSYKEVAIRAGSPHAARAVGNIMKANYRSHIPCHRVIKTSGALGQYNRGGPEAKKKILLLEQQ